MRPVGITETFDPCFVPDWETKLLDANIIISKELNDEMIEKLLIVQNKVIFHHTVTGQGGTVLEPNVKPPQFEFEQFKKLHERGFDLSHYVLRIDPIILFNPECMDNVKFTLNLWEEFCKKNNVILRCRVSIIDLYNHVLARLKAANVVLGWESFTAPQLVFDKAADILSKYRDSFVFECCAEQKFNCNFIQKIGCASMKDLAIIEPPDIWDYGMPEKKQRQECMCIMKKQILGVKPGRCGHQCLYCFWK